MKNIWSVTRKPKAYFGVPSRNVKVLWIPEVNRDGEISWKLEERELLHRLYYEFFNAINPCLIDRCKECGKAFLKSREGHEYCSKACVKRVNMRAYRERERAGRPKSPRGRKRIGRDDLWFCKSFAYALRSWRFRLSTRAILEGHAITAAAVQARQGRHTRVSENEVWEILLSAPYGIYRVKASPFQRRIVLLGARLFMRRLIFWLRIKRPLDSHSRGHSWAAHS